MLFNSLSFLFLFLPSAWATTQLVRMRAPRLLPLCLAAWSLAFYAHAGWLFLLQFLLSLTANFALSQLLHRVAPRSRHVLLTVGVVLNLAFLGYYKYLPFVAEVAASLTASQSTIEALALPVGISFYTFQQIAYLVDVAKGTPSEPSFVRYALCISFFPHLIAGPLVLPRELLPQLTPEQKAGSYAVVSGLTMLLIGLFKKVVLADTIAVQSTRIFAAAESGMELGFLDAWVGALSYTLQIYFDFSGYSDMAVGLARMFGIEMPINFASPYQARSIVEFWRRWHITLSRFLRTYVYIPLGGNRHGAFRQHMNVMLTMLIGGLWHGAGWQFIAWGAMHGAYLWIAHGWEGTAYARRLRTQGWWSRATMLVTFLAVVVAWVPFRANDLSAAVRVWTGMIGAAGPMTLAPFPKVYSAAVLGGLLVIALAAPNSNQIMAAARLGTQTPGYPAVGGSECAPALRWSVSRSWSVAFGLAFGLILMMMNDASEFIYFRF